MSLEKLPKKYKDSISLHLGLLNCVGITFEGSKGNSITNVVKLTVFSIAFFPFILTQFRLIGEIKADNFLETVRVVPVSVMFVLDTIKLLIGILKKTRIRDMLLEIGELWPKNLHFLEEKYAITKNWLRKMTILLNSFFIYALVNLTLFESVPFLTSVYYLSIGQNVYLFPFQFSGLWDVDSVLRYVLTYVWEVIATVSCQLCIYLPFDLIIVTLTLEISLLFRLLQVDLQNVITNRDQTPSNLDSYNAIRDIIRKHQKLLKLSKKLNEIFGIVIFIHVVFSSVVICFFGFMTVVSSGIMETVANLLTVLNPVFTIFLLALSGQLLCDTSSNVADAAYQCLWYICDVRIKRLILIVITRSQNPCYLSALGFSDMTLQSFSKIMSTSWTYLSLLIQLYEAD